MGINTKVITETILAIFSHRGRALNYLPDRNHNFVHDFQNDPGLTETAQMTGGVALTMTKLFPNHPV